MRRNALAIVALVASLGCEPRSQPANDEPQRPSTELETCSRTADCEGELRCRDGVCRSPKTVARGEYFAALGALKLEAQRYEQAIAAFDSAKKAYRDSNVAVPAEMECGHGEALLRGGGDPQRYELAARLVHRCMLGAPAGTALRRRALRLASELGREGLDPSLLDRKEPADRYMTATPAQPSTDNLVLTVSTEKPPRTHTFTRWLERAESSEVRTALLPCWIEHWQQTKSLEMNVSVVLKHSFTLDEHGDFGRTILEVLDPEPTGDSAMDAARKCAQGAINPIADAHTKGRSDERRWEAEMLFRVAPPSAD